LKFEALFVIIFSINPLEYYIMYEYNVPGLFDNSNWNKFKICVYIRILVYVTSS